MATSSSPTCFYGHLVDCNVRLVSSANNTLKDDLKGDEIEVMPHH